MGHGEGLVRGIHHHGLRHCRKLGHAVGNSGGRRRITIVTAAFSTAAVTTAAAAAVATAPTAVKQVLLSGGRLERGQTGKIKALKAAGETGEGVVAVGDLC